MTLDQEQSLVRLQKLFVETDRRFALAVMVVLAVAAGVLVGAYVAILSPFLAVIGVVAMVGGLLMLRDTRWSLMALIGLICLLPFGALPFDIGFTPTFLDIALIALYFVWIARIATGKAGSLIGTVLGMPIAVFLLLACASFVAGLGHSYLNTYVLRHFAEILLSIALFFVVVNTVQTREQFRLMVMVIVLAGFAAALVGVVLYVIPPAWSIRLLSMLGRVGYPTGDGVLRYVEDNPDLAMRAISTSTDPNVLGGLLILVTALTVSLLFSRQPPLPRILLGGIALVDALCLYLTYSRGSMAGLVAGLGLLAVIRYRRLIPAMAAGALVLLLLPQTQDYVQHFVEGIQLQDLATLMRLGEYKDAFALIARHPWIGVGFVSAPEVSLYIGVSNVYLLIAEEMGLVGLSVFFLIMVLFAREMWRKWPRLQQQPEMEGIALGLTAGLAGIMVGGMLDHYFFNLNFPHSVAIFWLYLGLAMVAVRWGGEK
ncbi:MAG: O-antigen ligase family protein [Anaerolineae bacterium]|nr:O-antigen ligase family protein [Anaerolineae bacterium]